MAASVVFGMPFGREIRNLWLCLGDIGTLARRALGKRPPSVLDGDGKFFAPLLRHLMQECSQASATGHRVDLSLTGTLVDPRPMFRYQHLGPAISEGRNRARFRFRHMTTESLLGSDFDPPDGRQRALAQLAYAARATSSFPGAFEPASIGFAPSSIASNGSIPATHFGVYSESRRLEQGEHDRDYVIDGGVLDNIPVAWAVRSIAAAPADVHVDRWLVYLQPIPFPDVSAKAAERPGMRATVKRAKELRGGTERLADDIDELQRLHAGALLRDGFRQVVEYALGEARDGESDSQFLDQLYKRALAGAHSYRCRQGAVEVGRLRQLWTDAMAVIGVDPLGYRDLELVNANRPDMAGLMRALNLVDGGDLVLPSGCAAEASETAGEATLTDRRDRLIEIGRRIRTPQALARTVAALLEAARACGDAGLASKQRLYGLRADVELLVARHDRFLAQQPLVGDSNPIEMARRALWLLAWPDIQPHALPQGLWPERSFDERWEALVDEAILLADVARDVADRALLSCLVKASSAQGARSAQTESVLVALELLTGPLRPDPLTESAHVQFHMLSALNRSPLPQLQHPPHDKCRRKSVAEKLAGNQLANFGALLTSRWRLNDWTWGRLDAARSLIEIVTTRALADDADVARRSALATVAGLDPAASRTDIVKRLVEQAHEAILEQELPLFSVVNDAPPQVADLRRARSSNAANVADLHAVGDETVRDVVLRNPARAGRTAAQLAVTAARAWLRS